MPPKKTLKTIAAEKKKKNTAEAEDIIAKLTLQTKKSSRDTTVKPKKSSKEETVKITAESKKNDTGKAKEIASKPESSTQGASKDQDMIPTTSDNAVPMETNLDPSLVSAIDHSRAIGRDKSVSTSQRTRSVKTSASSSKASKPSVSAAKARKSQSPTTNDNAVPMETNLDTSLAGGVSAVDHPRAIGRDKSVSTSRRTKSVESSTSTPKASKRSYWASQARKPENPKIGDYQYEIDCEKVEKDINVKDLQRYLETQLKVNGKKNNLDGTITIHCEGNTAVIKSNTFIPKKSLRFLSKKFLKRNWNIRVVSKNVHSYEYKYIGSL